HKEADWRIALGLKRVSNDLGDGNIPKVLVAVMTRDNSGGRQSSSFQASRKIRHDLRRRAPHFIQAAIPTQFTISTLDQILAEWASKIALEHYVPAQAIGPFTAF